MKKQIISNTILFAVIMVYVVIFQSIFGRSNLMVGVAVLIIGLVTIQKDMTQNLKLLLFELLAIMVYMGVASYVVTISSILSLFISVPFIFFITYWMTISSKKPYHFPYLLGYLFLLLSAPVNDLTLFPERLVSLVVGALLIWSLQYVSNKDTYKKILKSENQQALDFVEKRVNRILEGDYSSHPEEIEILKIGMKRFMGVTFERRNFRTVLTPASMYRISEIITMHKIYYLLDDVSNNCESGNESKTFLLDIKFLVEALKKENPTIATQIFERWQHEDLPDYVLKIKQAIKVLKSSENDEYPERKENIFKQLINIDTHSLSFKFAMRLTILLSVALLYTTFFDLEYGRWLCFTILALVQPGYEESVKKTWMRLVGTVIGVAAFLFLFSIFKSSNSHMIILMLTSYLSMYITRYDYRMVGTSIQSLGAAVVGTTGLLVAENRIGFIIFGAIVSLLGNRYLFTIREKDAINYMMEVYDKCKQYLLNHEKYPHTVIVEAYHALEVAKEEEKYKEWLDLSFNALKEPIQ